VGLRSAPLPSPPYGQGRGMYWPGRFSVQGEMQICHAFKTPTTLLHFLLPVNSQQTAADQYRCGIGLVSAIPIPDRYHWYRPDTDTEYWYRSKPTFLLTCWIKLIKSGSEFVFVVLRFFVPFLCRLISSWTLLLKYRIHVAEHE